RFFLLHALTFFVLTLAVTLFNLLVDVLSVDAHLNGRMPNHVKVIHNPSSAVVDQHHLRPTGARELMSRATFTVAIKRSGAFLGDMYSVCEGLVVLDNDLCREGSAFDGRVTEWVLHCRSELESLFIICDNGRLHDKRCCTKSEQGYQASGNRS